MTTTPPTAPADPDRPDWAAQARSLVRSAMMATLATLDRDDGTPYASMVAVATLHDGRPLLLLSKLALHTRNAAAAPRVSLLVDRREATEAALTGPRVTLMGELRASADPLVRSRYLARHPDAAMYADFADFSFYELVPSRGHFVGGFGRITPLAATELLDHVPAAAGLIAAEPEVLTHMNDDHGDAIAQMARVLGGAGEAGLWRLAGIDGTGFDLVCANRGLRLAFPTSVSTPDEVRRAFIALVGAARQSATAP